MNRTVIIIRWIARILSVFILLFWGYFIVAHLLAGPGHLPVIGLNQDSLLFSMMLLWLVGLGIAWRWELVGAAVTLATVLIAALMNPGAVGGPGVLPPITALLFLFCWCMSRASRDENSGA